MKNSRTLVLFISICLFIACIPMRETEGFSFITNRDIDSLKTEISQLQRQVEILSGRTDSLKSIYSSHQEKKSEELTAREKQIDSLYAVLEESNECVELLRDSIILYKLGKDSLDHDVNMLRSKLRKSKVQIEELGIEVDILRSKLDFAVVQIKPGVVDFYSSENIRISYLIVDSKGWDVRMHLMNIQGIPYNRIEKVKEELESSGKVVWCIMNAGMFSPSREPQGLYVENGKVVKPIDPTPARLQGPNFVLGAEDFPNGILLVKNDGFEIIQSTEWSEYQDRNEVVYATQSGPMLMHDGVRNPTFREGSTNLNIRNGAGVTKEGYLVLAISNIPINLWDFSRFFRSQNCETSLYLDGAISRAFIPELELYELGGNFGPMISVTKK